MAVTFGFYNSFQGDRKYNSEQMSRIFDGIIKDGVFASIGDCLVVKAAEGMDIHVSTGKAWFDHTWTENDALLPFTIDPAEDTLSRIDAVVLETNHEENVRANTFKVIKGSPAVDPVKPELVKSDKVNQHLLGYIQLTPGQSEIKQINIENCIGIETPFISGILETITIEGITAILEDKFNTWFESIKDILDENVAGNLLNMIENVARVQELEPTTVTKETMWYRVVGTNPSFVEP